MRKTSISIAHAKSLAKILKERRESLGLSMRELSARSGVQLATIVGLEHRDILAPQPYTLKALAKTLDLSITDVFTAIDWLPKDELPSLKPYMRAKYGQLPEAGVAELDAYMTHLADKYDLQGPLDGEDER